MSRSAPTQPNNSSLPRLPRFGLRALLAAMAIVSGLFALMEQIGPVWSLVLVWTLLLIAGHVLGNAWGSQSFRSRGSRHEDNEPFPVAAHRTGQSVDVAGTAQILLRQPIPAGWGRVAGSIVGALLFGSAGGSFLTIVYREIASLGAIAMWYVSCAVVGALAGFVTSGLVQVFAISVRAPRRPKA